MKPNEDFHTAIRDATERQLQTARAFFSSASDQKLIQKSVMKRYNISSRQTLHNWLHDPDLNFPRPIKLLGKNYFSLAELRVFESQFDNRFGSIEAEA